MQIILVSNPSDTKARQAIAKLQAVGLAQRQFFEEWGDVETKMFDNNPAGAYEESTLITRTSDLQTAIRQLSDSPNTQETLLESMDYSRNTFNPTTEPKISIYSPPSGRPFNNEHLQNGLQEKIYFKPPNIYPTDLSLEQLPHALPKAVKIIEVSSSPAQAKNQRIEPKKLIEHLMTQWHQKPTLVNTK